MPHVITQACCGDASCVFACPVNCIHPTPDEPDFLTSEMLYIDPDSCVDCGACVSACPVGAIAPDTKLTAEQLPFVDINALFYREPRSYPIQAPVPSTVRLDARQGPLRVAIVGSGPAALYAADELLKQRDVTVNVLEKLPTPHGLVRAGVAPDHQQTKTVEGLFRHIENQDGFSYFLNVEVGTDITHAELLAHHHAVIYATGASLDRTLGIPGESLPGSGAATDFVAWYNGHLDFAEASFDFSAKRAVIVGNGNVALDVARILTADPAELESTDIADHALAALKNSRIEEVVLLARRGVAQAAYSLPELVGLLSHTDVDFAVEGNRRRAEGLLDQNTEQKIAVMADLASRSAVSESAPPGRKRIVFRYLTSPTELIGAGKVEGVRVTRNELAVVEGRVRAVPAGATELIEAGLVLRSIGYRGQAVTGCPFDDVGGVIPNDHGRVLDAVGGTAVSGVYSTGWIKRGPSGFIGTNKTCAQETVACLLADFNGGLLAAPGHSMASLSALIAKRRPDVIGLNGWREIDKKERRIGADHGKVREKFTDPAAMIEAARSAAVVKRRRARLSR